MTPNEINNIAVELKRLGSELNLSDQQKDQLKTFLSDKYEKFQEYKQQNPNVSKEDAISARLVAVKSDERHNNRRAHFSTVCNHNSVPVPKLLVEPARQIRWVDVSCFLGS